MAPLKPPSAAGRNHVLENNDKNLREMQGYVFVLAVYLEKEQYAR
jgi:hypothetical protein